MAVLIAARGGRLALGPPRSGAAARARLEPGYSPRVTCRSGRKVVATASRPVESGTVTDEAAVPVPRSIAEVDNGKILGFGAKLSEEHPGFGDEAYEQRRMDIVGLAARHTLGEAIPAIDYSPEEEIWHLTKVYWYTVEFGVVRQGGEIKAFGAGILSSFGELQHMKTDAPSFLPFDPFSPQPKMSYKDGFQSRYFVMESFKTGCQQLSDFAATLMK
eukprot:jgi/Tetstr1/459375/TSEL_004754.t1